MKLIEISVVTVQLPDAELEQSRLRSHARPNGAKIDAKWHLGAGSMTPNIIGILGGSQAFGGSSRARRFTGRGRKRTAEDRPMKPYPMRWS